MKNSVIIATYNRADFIQQCLDSVLNQAVHDYEIIVIDDGSTDQTKEILKKYEQHPFIKVFFHGINKGLMAARNTGRTLSKGEYLAFTDSDCIVRENWLEELIKPFSFNQKIAIVGGKILDPPSRNYWELVNRGSNYVARQSGYVHEIIGCNMAFRREFLSANLFDTTFKYGGDEVDLCLICRKSNQLIYYTDSSCVTHYHRTSMKSTLKQQFNYGFSRTYVNIKHNVFPYLNKGTFLLLLSACALMLGLTIARIFLLVGGVSLMLYLLLIFYLSLRSKQWDLMPAIYAFPGQLLGGAINCWGNIYYLLFLIRRGSK